MVHTYKAQPYKGLYLTYHAFLYFFLYLPWYTLSSIRKESRPRTSWTLKRAILVNSIRHFLDVTTRTGPLKVIPNHMAITPGVDVNGVWIEPADDDLIVGVLSKWAEIAHVQSIPIPGYWTHKKGSNIPVQSPPQPGEKIFMMLHGGVYIRLSAHPSDPTAAIARGLLEHVDTVNRVFSVEYRLASYSPDEIAHPFPTQLIDALAGYQHLVGTLGFRPDDIIVVGDSAGGNLSLALVRYLVEHQGPPSIPPPPGALLLLSPWADIGTSHYDTVSKYITSDYLGTASSTIAYAKNAFLGPHGWDFANENPYVSPASLNIENVKFTDFPRTCIVCGGAEVLTESIKTLKTRMEGYMGGEGDGVRKGDGKVRYLEAPDGVHDFLVFPWFEPERTNILRDINKWVNAH